MNAICITTRSLALAWPKDSFYIRCLCMAPYFFLIVSLTLCWTYNEKEISKLKLVIGNTPLGLIFTAVKQIF